MRVDLIGVMVASTWVGEIIVHGDNYDFDNLSFFEL
jgi:hypothetical protein